MRSGYLLILLLCSEHSANACLSICFRSAGTDQTRAQLLNQCISWVILCTGAAPILLQHCGILIFGQPISSVYTTYIGSLEVLSAQAYTVRRDTLPRFGQLMIDASSALGPSINSTASCPSNDWPAHDQRLKYLRPKHAQRGVLSCPDSAGS